MGYTTSLGGVETVVSAVTAVTQDPCLTRVSQLVLRLHELEQPAPRRPTTGGTPPKPPPPVKGIGLCTAVKPLEAAVWVKERPWVLPLGAVAIVGGLVGIGFALGRRRGRRS